MTVGGSNTASRRSIHVLAITTASLAEFTLRGVPRELCTGISTTRSRSSTSNDGGESQVSFDTVSSPKEPKQDKAKKTEESRMSNRLNRSRSHDAGERSLAILPMSTTERVPAMQAGARMLMNQSLSPSIMDISVQSQGSTANVRTVPLHFADIAQLDAEEGESGTEVRLAQCEAIDRSRGDNSWRPK